MTQDMRRTESDTDAVRQGMKVQSESREPAVAGADLAVARRVLDVEARAISTLAGLLDGCFIEAVARLAAIEGRVIVTGMGKSGHVARKIAANLASTGPPALFVHPGEASPRDLGLLPARDGAIPLANPDNTPALAHNLP